GSTASRPGACSSCSTNRRNQTRRCSPPKPFIGNSCVLRVELLDGTHDRGGFDCGVEPLNRYLQQIARQHIAKEISKTFVLVDEHAVAPKPVLGFFTISLCQLLGDRIPPRWAKKLPAHIPAMRL